jgi:hypothetical protein
LAFDQKRIAMRIIGITGVGSNFLYSWPAGKENFDHYIDYRASGGKGEHQVRLGFCHRTTYKRNRIRVVVLIDGRAHAEFLGADDVEKSGEVVVEIKVPGERGERICRYPDEPIPERYNMFNVEGLKLRVKGKGVHGAWAVVANIGDHATMIALAGLRKLERMRRYLPTT